MKQYKQLILPSIIIVIADVVILTSFVWYNKPTPDVSIAELIVVPFIIGLNLVIAMMVSFFGRNQDTKKLAILITVNAVVASFIFHGIWIAWYSHYDKENFIGYVYEQNGKHYELSLDKRDNTYSFYKINNPGSSTEFKQGKYEQHLDSIILIDTPKRLLVYKNQLIGYPSLKDTTHLLGEK